MLHNTQDEHKSTPLLRSRNLDSAIKDETQASTEGGIHHTNLDFDALIQEDEARRRDEQSHHVDIDNLDFSQESENTQDAVTARVDNGVDVQDVVTDIPNQLDVETDVRPISISGHSGIGYGKLPEMTTFAKPQQKLHNANHVGFLTTLALFLTIAGIAMISYLVIRKRRAKKRLGKEVFKYIMDFDVEDIDLTKAVTGGWHGTYKGNLRDGFVTDDTDDDDKDFADDIEEFADDIEDDEDNDDDDIIDRMVYEDSTRSCRTQEIVFMDEEQEDEEMLVGHKNIFFRPNDDDDIYYTSDDDLFRPVSEHRRSR